jgi:cyclin-dependent kinase 8/11
MSAWRARKDAQRATVQSKYSIQGFISSGTYGRVYKARERERGKDKDKGDKSGDRNMDKETEKDKDKMDVQDSKTGEPSKFYAIKKFKPEKEGEVLTYTGISQSAIREIAVSSFFAP